MDEQDAEAGEADILLRLGEEINDLKSSLELRREKRLWNFPYLPANSH